MTHSIWTGALIAVMVCAPAPSTQDRPDSMASRLLERLDRLAERLDDDELGSDLREEMRDLMEMLKAQLSEGRYSETLDSYRRAAGDVARGINLDALKAFQGARELNLEGLKALDLNLENLSKNLEGLKALDLSELNLESLSELRNLEGLKALDLSEQLKDLGELRNLDLPKLLEENLDNDRVRELRDNWRTLQDRGLDYADVLRRRVQDPENRRDIEATLEKVREVLRETLQSVDDESVQKILESVREALGDDTNTTYSRLRNLYRGQGDEAARSFDLYRDSGEWRRIMEEATRDWQRYADDAREQWQKAMEESRRDLDEQMKRAMESYRRALERRRDGDEPNPFAVWSPDESGNWSFSTEGGKSFFVQPKEGDQGTFWRFSDEGEPQAFNFKPSEEGGNVFWTAPGDGEPRVFNFKPPEEGGNVFWTAPGDGEPRIFNFKPSEEGGNVFWVKPGEDQPQFFNIKPSGEGGNFFWTLPDGKKSGVFRFEGGGNFIFTPVEEGEAVVGTFSPLEGDVRTIYGVEEKPEMVEEPKERSFLESFRQDMNRRATRVEEPEAIVEIEPVEELEADETTLVELGETERVELGETERVELGEPVLLETREPRSTDDANAEIRDMVEQLRKDMQEIRELIKALREKARNQPR